jgi:hypothetical protein
VSHSRGSGGGSSVAGCSVTPCGLSVYLPIQIIIIIIKLYKLETLLFQVYNCKYTYNEKKLMIFITGLHYKPQGCSASVASAAGPFITKNTLTEGIVNNNNNNNNNNNSLETFSI